MAYCKSCGAYIPDGLTACLACGYDELAEQQKATPQAGGAAAAKKTPERDAAAGGKEKYKQVDSEFLRQQLEEQRKRQQANSKKWAETEYAQRRKTREEQTRNFTNTSGRSGSDFYRAARSVMANDDVGKALAGLSYVSFLFVLPYLFRRDDAFATYHAKQGMGLFIAGIVGDIVGGLLGVGWLVTIARIFMAVTGISNVINGKKRPLPYIGNLFR